MGSQGLERVGSLCSRDLPGRLGSFCSSVPKILPGSIFQSTEPRPASQICGASSCVTVDLACGLNVLLCWPSFLTRILTTLWRAGCEATSPAVGTYEDI